jgi:hypothetical protein
VIESLPDDSAAAPDLVLDRQRAVERLWAEIEALPIRQRLALLLSLRERQGSSLLWVFPLTGVASIRRIAAVLEMDAVELSGLWNRLPLDDHAIADRLGTARQQVINLRSAARKRLGNRLGERIPSPGPANIHAVRASKEQG